MDAELTRPPRNDRVHYSIRQLLAASTLTALGLGGFLFGPPVSWMALTVVSALFLKLVIDVLVGGVAQRNVAIGFLVPAIGYLVATAFIGSSEYDISKGKLPTTVLLQKVLRPAYDDVGMTLSSIKERRANSTSVLPLGHSLFALLVGVPGSLYARRILGKSNTDGVPS